MAALQNVSVMVSTAANASNTSGMQPTQSGYSDVHCDHLLPIRCRSRARSARDDLARFLACGGSSTVRDLRAHSLGS